MEQGFYFKPLFSLVTVLFLCIYQCILKVKKSGMPPGPRAGFSMCVHKKRALFFGGVVDMEVGGLFFQLYLTIFAR